MHMKRQNIILPPRYNNITSRPLNIHTEDHKHLHTSSLSSLKQLSAKDMVQYAHKMLVISRAGPLAVK